MIGTQEKMAHSWMWQNAQKYLQNWNAQTLTDCLNSKLTLRSGQEASLICEVFGPNAHTPVTQ